MGNKIDKAKSLFINLNWILYNSFKASKPKFILRLIITLLYVALPILSAWYLKKSIDLAVNIPTSNQTSIDLNLLILYVIIKIFFDLSWYFADNVLEALFKIMRFDLEFLFTKNVLHKLSNTDLEFFENSKFLDLKQKVIDTYTSHPTEFLNVAFWSLYNVIQVLVQGAILYSLNPWWILLLYLFQLPSLVILIKIGQSSWNIWSADSNTRRKFFYFANLFSTTKYIKEFRIFDTAEFFTKKALEPLTKFHKNQKNIEVTKTFKGYLGVLLSLLPTIYITIDLIFKLASGEISVGLISFYLTSLAAFSLALQNLVKNINYGYEINNYISDIRLFLNLKNNISNNGQKYIQNTTPPSIEFKDVTFAYPGSKRGVLKNFNLSIKPGEKIAIVGENGSGKTTIIKLLCRMYELNKGNIYINKTKICDIELKSYRKILSALFQDFATYDLTVNENIQIGKIRAKISKKRIRVSSKMAAADKFIQTLPKKYEQLLGNTFENGEELSIGQWQKIAISRAFYRNSPILILDEPTSAVDTKTENEIFKRIMKLIKNKTVIMISHRFSTVKQADRIIVLNKGKIVEDGNHDSLMKLKGIYYKSFNLQAGAYIGKKVILN